MDLKVLMDDSNGRWTEERHSLFLNLMEASFVRRMLAGDGGAAGPVPGKCTEMNVDRRLDRYVPDSATESTGDSRKRSPAAKATATVPAVLDSEPRCAEILTSGSENTRTWKRPLACLIASQDQVVPEMENSEDGDAASGSVKRKLRRGLRRNLNRQRFRQKPF